MKFKNQNVKLKQTIAMMKTVSKEAQEHPDHPLDFCVPILADIATSLAILADHVIIVDDNEEATEL